VAKLATGEGAGNAAERFRTGRERVLDLFHTAIADERG
jgi:hypothetical protein